MLPGGKVRRGLWLAALLTVATPPLAAAQANDAPAPGAELIEQARAQFAIDDISGPDGKGRYRMPEASSGGARAARRLLEQAIAAGNADAHRLLGRMVEAGAGGPQDFAAARRHYALAGEDRIAYWRHGLLLLTDRGGVSDPALARRLFQLAGGKGLIDASYELARMTELGLGGPRDEAAARRAYEDMSEWCHGDMADRYSVMLMRGVGGSVDRERAATLQIKAFECHNSNFKVPAALSRPDLFDPETIAAMQKQLQGSGYAGPLDGSFNPATRAALRSLSSEPLAPGGEEIPE